MLALDDFESADAAADEDAHALGVVRIDLAGRTEPARIREAAMPNWMKRPIFLISFFSMKRAGSKFLTSPAMRQLKRGGVELLDAGDAVPALANGLPALLGANAKRAQQADSCDYYSARQQ